MKKQEQRLRRALYLVPYLAKQAGDIPLSELAEFVGARPADLEKELRALLMVGVPESCDYLNVYVDGAGPSAVVSALPSHLLKRPPRLTVQEALALLIGAEAVKATGIRTYEEAIARAAGKIRAMLGESGKGQPACDAIVLAAPASQKRETLASLSRACRDHRTVEMDYASVSSQRRRPIRLEPYGLLNHTGAWYVLGRSLTHQEDRIFVFKVERILGVTVLPTTFTVPKDFDVNKYRGDRMFISDWKPAEGHPPPARAGGRAHAGLVREGGEAARRQRRGPLQGSRHRLVGGVGAAAGGGGRGRGTGGAAGVGGGAGEAGGGGAWALESAS